jgi:hypothetical protein
MTTLLCHVPAVLKLNKSTALFSNQGRFKKEKVALPQPCKDEIMLAAW